MQRVTAATSIYNSGQVQMVYINVSKNIIASTDKLYTIDNLILVNFTNANPSLTDINNFMTQFNLTLFSAPSINLPATASPSYTYIFETNASSTNYEYLAGLLRDIYTQSTIPINSVSPNIIITNLSEANETINQPPGSDPEPAKIYTICTQDINDPGSDYQCYLDNNGFMEDDVSILVTCTPDPNNPTSTIDADADICECWDKGLTGQDIKVAILGSGNYNKLNPDLLTTQVIADAWDCTINPAIALQNGTSTFGSLQLMAGMIGAEKNNNISIAGIAEKSIISLYKMGDYNTVTSANVVTALQKTLEIKVDIIVLDYNSEIEVSNIKDELYKHHESGREKIEDFPLGTIIIAPAGTRAVLPADASLATISYPAIYNIDDANKIPEVIGVIGSNRYDKIQIGEEHCNLPNTSNIGGSENFAFTSKYGNKYDVAAPAYAFPSLYGLNNARMLGHMLDFHSYPISIVGGVAALLLQQYPTETDIQIMERLRDGAEKVGGYNYTSTFNKSTELAGGRISCIGAFNNYPLQIIPSSTNTKNISITYAQNNWQIKINKQYKSCNYKVINSLGQIIKSDKFLNSQTQFFDCKKVDLSKGIYYIMIALDNNIIETYKLIN